MTVSVLAVVILMILPEEAAAFIAFDCETSFTLSNTHTLSLKELKKCEIPIKNPSIKEVEIQLLQAAPLSSIHVIQCKIEIQRDMLNCIPHQNNSVKYDKKDYIQEIESQVCRDIHATGTYHDKHRNVFYNLKANSSTRQPTNFVGYIGANNEGCNGSLYMDEYRIWLDVVVSGNITISLMDYEAAVDTENDEVTLRSGVKCAYTKGKCFDTEGGYTFWDVVTLTGRNSCDYSNVELLYQGPAQRVADSNVMEAVYLLNTIQMTYIFSGKEYQYSCNHIFIPTEHVRIFIIDNRRKFLNPDSVKIKQLEMEIFPYTNTKLVYFPQEYLINNLAIRFYNDLRLKQCQVQRAELVSAMGFASTPEFGYHLMKKPGYIAHATGEVIQIQQCIPVEVSSRNTTECYQELPIFRGDEEFFMMPFTRILTKIGNVIPCDKLLAPQYEIDGKWHLSSNRLQTTDRPSDALGSDPPRTLWKFGSTSFYSAQYIHNVSQYLLLSVQKLSILHSVFREVGNDGDDDNLTKFIHKEWNKIQNEQEEEKYFFYKLGELVLPLVGIWFCYRVLKTVVDVMIRCYSLHNIYGCKIYLLGALWNCLTKTLMERSENEDAAGGLLNEKPDKTPKHLPHT